MNADTSAVPAGVLLESFTKLTEKPVIKKKTTSQDKIASLANSDAYKALQEEIEGFIKELKNIPVDPTDDVTKVGFKYLASQITIEYLERVSNMPKLYAEIKKIGHESNNE